MRDLVNLQKKRSCVPLITCCWQHRAMLGSCCSHLWCPDLTPEGFLGQNRGGKQSPQGCQPALLDFTPFCLTLTTYPARVPSPPWGEFLLSAFRPHRGRSWSRNVKQELLAAALQVNGAECCTFKIICDIKTQNLPCASLSELEFWWWALYKVVWNRSKLHSGSVFQLDVAFLRY